MDKETNLSVEVDCWTPCPFLVRAESNYGGLLWCGEGATWWFLVLPGYAVRLKKGVIWMS